MSLELVIAFPAMLLLITAIVQTGLWFHARTLTLGAAEHGVDVARAYDTPPGLGTDAARDFLVAQGASTLTDTNVVVSRSDVTVVEIKVSGRVISVLPGMPGPKVSASARGPIERVTIAGQP